MAFTRNENKENNYLIQLVLKDGTLKDLSLNRVFKESYDFAKKFSGYISENRVYVDGKRVIDVQMLNANTLEHVGVTIGKENMSSKEAIHRYATLGKQSKDIENSLAIILFMELSNFKQSLGVMDKVEIGEKSYVTHFRYAFGSQDASVSLEEYDYTWGGNAKYKTILEFPLVHYGQSILNGEKSIEDVRTEMYIDFKKMYEDTLKTTMPNKFVLPINENILEEREDIPER